MRGFSGLEQIYRGLSTHNIFIPGFLIHFRTGPDTSAFDDTQTHYGNTVSAGIGIETLHYSENEPDTRVKSESSTVNILCYVGAEKQWGDLSFSAIGTFPVYAWRNTETWTRGSGEIQTNNVCYEWYRVEGRLGYLFKKWLIPYTGLRWSEAIQKRDHFSVEGTSVTGSALETVFAYDLPAGFRGDIPINSVWQMSYDVCFYQPINSKVDNSNFPEVTIRDVDAYGIGATLGATYHVSKLFSARCQGLWGQIHRHSSQWVVVGDGSAKYPENDTKILSLTISVLLQF